MKKVAKFITALLLAILVPCVVLVCIILGASLLGKNFERKPAAEVSTEALSEVDYIESTEESVFSDETIASEEPITFEESTFLEEPATEPVTIDSSDIPSKISKELSDSVTFILNTDSMQFHFKDCFSTEEITPSNLAYFSGNREETITLGYSPCENCNP